MKFENIPQFSSKEKSQERLQTQTEAFADKGVKNFSKFSLSLSERVEYSW